MREQELLDYQFEYLISLLGGAERVEQLAYEKGAFVRSRKVESPVDLLRLLMTWSIGGYSLEETAAVAAESGIADVSDVALLKRFRRCRGWVGALLSELLGTSQVSGPFRMRLVDATTVSKPGSRGTDHRLHVSFSLSNRCIDAVELTDGRGGEALERFCFSKGDLMIGDRGYAHRSGLGQLVAAEAFYVLRIPWQNVPLHHHDGTRVDLLSLLRSLPEAEASEFRVQVPLADGTSHDGRLVAVRRSEPAAEAAREKIVNQKRKKGQSIDPRTLEAAGFFFVLTNLPEDFPADEVLALYRMRWQIEMKFKIMKSVTALDHLPVRDQELAQTYVITKLLATLMVDQLVNQYDSFSPWGYPLRRSAAKSMAA